MALSVSRIYQVVSFFLLIGILLMSRLFYLQIIENTNLASESLSMRMQEVAMEVPRGEILDRTGLALTDTTQHFTLLIFTEQLENIERESTQLAELTGLSSEYLIEQITRHQRPFKVQASIDAMTGKKINSLHLPGVMVVPEKSRYAYRSIATHVTGYINDADNEGISGIESIYDDVLRGDQPEYAAVVVDARRKIIPGIGYKRLRLPAGARPSNVVLTIDRGIQSIVESIMDRHAIKGAVVILQPATGEVLAMASRPNFDANHIEDYLAQRATPLLNRAILSYQPGSVFKLVTAAAALENHIVTPDQIFFDSGYIEVEHLRFNGWDYQKGGRGQLTFTEALAYSSNPIFIQIGLQLGADKLVSYAKKFGFGHKTSLDFTGEAAGNLPIADQMYSGELANLAIGQGEFEATPLQVVSLVATIANDGVKVDPHLVSKLTNADGVVVKEYQGGESKRILSKKTAKELQSMMMAVTRYGTGQSAYVEGGGSAGKTGSAETGRKSMTGQGISHAWFAGYAPLLNPQYAVVVFVEDGMSGGDIAAPIFGEIIQELVAR